MQEVDADLLAASKELLRGLPKPRSPPRTPAGRQRRAAAPGRAGPGSRRVSDSLAPSAGASRDTERALRAAAPRAVPGLALPGSRGSQNQRVLWAGKDGSGQRAGPRPSAAVLLSATSTRLSSGPRDADSVIPGAARSNGQPPFQGQRVLLEPVQQGRCGRPGTAEGPRSGAAPPAGPGSTRSVPTAWDRPKHHWGTRAHRAMVTP